MKIPEVIHMFGQGYLTKGELYGALLRIASKEPQRLQECRRAIDVPVLVAGFDRCLRSAMKPGVVFIIGEGPAWSISEDLKEEIRKLLIDPIPTGPIGRIL